jgi:hypothetical protein
MRINAYRESMTAEWDAFVAGARNATFLHRRGFMDYHASRFSDASAIVTDEAGSWLAVFPANRDQDAVVSHGGLTYGGLLMAKEMRQSQCLAAFEALRIFYLEQGCRRVVYKPVPHIFHTCPAEDDLYALFRMGGRLIRRDASTVISLRDNFSYNQLRKRAIGKGRKAGLEIRRQSDPAAFHELLCSVLERHKASPVHSLGELRLLMGRFPEEILLFEAVKDSCLFAAVLVFDCGNAVHTQYLAASDAGRDIGALDFLLADLIEQHFRERRYLSFGISTEQAGTVLNEGLIAQKEGFGGRTVVHDFYEWVL